METVKPKSAINSRSKKLAKKFQKVISLRSATKIGSNNGICMLNSHLKVKEDPFTDHQMKTHQSNGKHEDNKARNRAVMEALIARLFAGVTTIKAAYAELQMAQRPYNNESIQMADQAVVDELRAVSEFKRRFLKKELDLSPQVTVMLAEIQEQQGLMKTYEITIKKLEAEVDVKDNDISSLRKHLDDCIAFNKSLEKKLNSSGSLSQFDNLRLSVLNPTHFVHFLHHTLRSMRSFVKLMIKEMESAHWDLEAAVKFIHPNAVFTKPSHRCFAFESFVCITMFEGFNYPNFSIQDDPLEKRRHDKNVYFDKFKKLKSLNPKQYLSHNPNSSFSRFLKSKYLQVVHAKMECSLFGNLNQRKLVNSGGYPDSAFFIAFAEMAKRVWALHCLALSFEEDVTIFQVKKNTRFSEVYMECVTEEPLSTSGESSDSNSGELKVAFTVVPGFKIGKTVLQSQVYLSLVGSPASC
ncbi:protein GRAVITROPIC IN THE LIGHT 1 [Gastrolobium bilobum]|uniref:protein GRAVITROPIC IN THE LIGHT 1 n=1 Tax=Gastrolobium bilobum TaxID=150636 RepID=UPI002AB089E7|nr:protein GRAVITROPIC IN THE LIGHT 1 [Gastrolobium bilobum]